MLKAEHLQYPEISVADLIARMKALYDCRTDRQLADVLGIKDVIFMRWRQRNTFHKELVFAVAFENGVSINHLLFGWTENTISAELTEAEFSAAKTICQQQGLTEAGLVRFALRLYQEVSERLANGERIAFNGDDQTSTVIIAPLPGPLRSPKARRQER